MIQHKKVCIPNIGTFELVQHSPEWNVADKIFLPPFFVTTFTKEENLSNHQLDFFYSKEKFKNDLISFGEKLKNKIQQDVFVWNGLGMFRYEFNELIFEPLKIELNSLQPVPAERTIRENPQYTLLSGEQELTSAEASEVLNQQEEIEKQKRPLFIIIGWILFILALLAIIIFLYINKFEPNSSGLQLNAK